MLIRFVLSEYFQYLPIKLNKIDFSKKKLTKTKTVHSKRFSTLTTRNPKTQPKDVLNHSFAGFPLPFQASSSRKLSMYMNMIKDFLNITMQNFPRLHTHRRVEHGSAEIVG